MLSNTMRLDFCYLKTIHILHPRYHSKTKEYILKNTQRNKCICIHEIIGLIIKNIKMKLKNRSHTYDIYQVGSRYSKYSNHKKVLSKMML